MKEKKKNIFDTDIEMIDLDSVGDLEFRYEELGAPNQELSDDLNMVMKETQVFSSDEIEKALERMPWKICSLISDRPGLLIPWKKSRAF